MTNLGTTREIAKYFAMSSINIRPDACDIIFDKLMKLTYTDEKR